MTQIANDKNQYTPNQATLDLISQLLVAQSGGPAGKDGDALLPPEGKGNTGEGDAGQLPTLPKGGLSGLNIALDVLFQAIGEKERQAELSSGMAQIKANTDRKAEQNQKILEKAKENLEKLEKAGFWDKFKEAFAWIGAIAAVVVSAALVATGVGAVAVAGLVVACVALANQVLDKVGTAVNGEGWGLTSLAAKGLGKLFGEEATPWIKMALDLAIAITGMIVSCGGSASTAVSSLSKVATSAMKAGAAVQTVAGLGAGAASIASGAYHYQASSAQADQKMLQKILEQLQMMNDLTLKHVENVIKEGQKITDTVTEIVKQNAATQTAIMTNSAGPSGMA